ncbi:ABC transporter ATP-binding protein [Flavobacteriaceae bacterium F89]|uniref:ABC transporter ATP-binding protein n=1 Tax=Cerina litoralis TaxID=2874477 RepID=A0AAE3ETH9_9FLAO|nr:ABC transporter ATP-binding protein [Cerina litoralis]MCG2459306.1 ABC transporter ATP-binding protein [Cerina litoralis]
MLQIDAVSFSYHKKPVLQDLQFTVGRGEHVAIMGESGCGKSTLLKIIYGLLQPDNGSLTWKDQPILGPDFNLVPGESYIKYLSQDFDLMPFVTVAENISQFLSVFYPEELDKRTQELLEMVDLVDYAQIKVNKVSGGQQQRVALARVLAQEPEVLLLDEPFSHIDTFRKNNFRRNLFEYLKKREITCITASHDFEDVLPFADRTFVLKDQRIVAKGPTLELYRKPKDLYVATLFGEANQIPIDIVKSYANTKRKIIVYAHEFRVSSKSGIPVTVVKNYAKGSHFLVEGLCGPQKIYFNSDEVLKLESEVFLNISLETINLRLREN